MQEYTLNHNKLIIHDLPKGAIQVCVYMGYLQWATRSLDYSTAVTDDILNDPVKLINFTSKSDPSKSGFKIENHAVKAPDGYRMLALSQDITEEILKAEDLIENIGNSLTIIGDAFPNELDDDTFFETRLESFRSWEELHKILALTGNVVILIKD